MIFMESNLTEEMFFKLHLLSYIIVRQNMILSSSGIFEAEILIVNSFATVFNSFFSFDTVVHLPSAALIIKKNKICLKKDYNWLAPVSALDFKNSFFYYQIK